MTRLQLIAPEDKRKRVITGWRQVPRPGSGARKPPLPIARPKVPPKIPLE